MLNAETYLAVNHWQIEQVADDPSPLEHWGAYVESGQLLAHPTAWVAPGARIVGPVLLGPSVKVASGATIVGPTTLGAECQVGDDALVSRTVAWNRCRIGAYAPGTSRSGLESGVLYWHMVDLVWVLLFPLVYLLG